MQTPRGHAAIPSLVADDAAQAEPASSRGLLAELEGPEDARRRSPAARFAGFGLRSLGVAVSTLALLALVLAWLLPGRSFPVGGIPVEVDASSSPGQASVGADLSRPAVILDDPPPSRIVAAGIDHAGDGPETDPLQLLRTDVAVPDAPVPTTRRRPAARSDSDVDLLAALMRHAGRSDASPAATIGTPPGGAQAHVAEAMASHAAEVVSQALASCPPANTDAGLDCRQGVCSDRWGEHASCPRPMGRHSRPE